MPQREGQIYVISSFRGGGGGGKGKNRKLLGQKDPNLPKSTVLLAFFRDRILKGVN